MVMRQYFTLRMTVAILLSMLAHGGFLLYASAPATRSSSNASSTQAPSSTLLISLGSKPPVFKPKGAASSSTARGLQPSQPPTLLKEDTVSGWNMYWPTRLLDKAPVVIADIPTDPPELRNYSEGGMIKMTLLIGANGKVDSVVVDSSTLPVFFSDVFKRYFLFTEFQPGIRDGMAVRSSMRIELKIAPIPEKKAQIAETKNLSP